MTQAQAAERLGMTTPNFQRIEHGLMDVKLSTIHRIAKALGVQPFELLQEPHRKPQPPGRPKKRKSGT